MTTYLVLRKHDTPKAIENGASSVRVLGGYELVGQFDAHDAKGAVKQAILAMTADEQKAAASETFAATPAASWREVSPKVETTTVVSFA